MLYLRFMLEPKITLNLSGKLLVLDKPAVMGVINVTEDSFYAGSRFLSKDAVMEQAGGMLEEGALWLDIGAMSSRPGATISNPEEEADRVVPVVAMLHQAFPAAFLSIDTVHASVARAAWEAGASMVNDISAGTMDAEMFPFVAGARVPYVLTHMKGRPEGMQDKPQYDRVEVEVLDFLIAKHQELKALGAIDILVDPGFGFGKSLQHNYRLLNQLHLLKILECPILVGISRKSMVYRTIQGTPEEALYGTTALHFLALEQGALVLRVHDVKPAVDAIAVWLACAAARAEEPT